MGPRGGGGGGGVETEVSCLRRWLAEEDRSREKNPSPVCVFVCWVIHQGLKRGRGAGCVCVSRGGVICGYYFEQRRRWDKCEGKSDHFWVCFSCVSKCKDSNHRPLTLSRVKGGSADDERKRLCRILLELISPLTRIHVNLTLEENCRLESQLFRVLRLFAWKCEGIVYFL